MGFYGNITNTIKTNLQFDKRYSNRFEMEAKQTTDGVYAGRYILIEYDLTWDNTNLTNDQFKILYEGIIDGKVVQSTSPDLSIAFTPQIDVIYRVVEIENITTGLSIYTNKYYIGVNDEKGVPTLKVASNSDSAYVTNFNIDTNYYGDSRGWDSTVWMKSYDTNGTPYYVNVAELNSVVPTFAISVDAPTEIPQSPHFDESNTNIFYTLHLQPQWGFQIKEAENIEASDVTADRTYRTYNENNVVQKEDIVSDVPMNIYYNAAGFDEVKKVISTLSDSIRMENTGVSGKYYNDPSHRAGYPVVGGQVDTYEFSMLIPSLGNAVSSMWDAVYEVDESTNIRKRDVAWKDAFIRDTEDSSKGGMSSTLNTLAGTINAAHKLMGMIVTKTSPSYLNESGYNNHFIYEDGNSYYRIVKIPVMTLANTINNSTKYYIQHNNGSYELANPNIGGRDYYYISDYTYDYVELPNFYDSLSTMHGLLLKLAEMLDLNNENSIDTTTVQGCINQLNSIINVFGELVPGQFIIVNQLGEIVSSSWTTEQTFTYTNEFNGTTATEEESEENCWITVSVDPAEKLITILHNLARSITGTSTTTNFDADEYTSTSAEFSLYTPIIDGAGHVVGKNNETVILPSGIKNINSNSTNSVETDLDVSKNSIYTSDNIKDTFNIDVGNKWIKSTIEDKTLTLAHSVNTIADDVTTTNLNANAENSLKDVDTITLQDILYDKAGHITSNYAHTYTLPYSYKYLKTIGNADSIILDFKTITTTTDDQGVISNTINLPTSTQHNANKVFSTLNLNPYNKWIQTKIIGDENSTTIQIAHTVPNKISETLLTNSLSDSNFSFVTTNFTYDAAGHVLTKQNITNTLPNNFAQFKIINKNTISPVSAYDTLNLSGDSWIKLEDSLTDEKREVNDTIKYSHGSPFDDANKINLSDNNNVSPAFGEDFKVSTFTYDDKGHIYSAASYNITIPPITTSDTADGNVIVSSGVDDADKGKLVFNKANIGALAVTGYEIGTGYNALEETDSLNDALGKLEAGYIANKSTLDVLTGTEEGSISTIVSSAVGAVTDGDSTTIKALNAALQNKINIDDTYTITSSDRTKTLTGSIETILKDMLDLILENSTPPENSDNAGTTE